MAQLDVVIIPTGYPRVRRYDVVIVEDGKRKYVTYACCRMHANDICALIAEALVNKQMSKEVRALAAQIRYKMNNRLLVDHLIDQALTKND